MTNFVTEYDFMMAMSFDNPQYMNSGVIEAYLGSEYVERELSVNYSTYN